MTEEHPLQLQDIDTKSKQIYNNNRTQAMSNEFFSIETLQQGTRQMVEVIKHCATQIFESTEGTVLPPAKPGFLRNQLAQTAPEEGAEIEYLMEMTKSVIFPGAFRWQSPKFFGYYPSSINVTNVFADMFAVINQTPNFSFATSPAFTQLQNVIMDWCAKSLGLPQKFLLKNAGGGIINNSATESIFTSVHAAKYQKMKQLNIQGNNPDVLKLVGYFGQGSHISSERALTLKDIYYKRPVPYKYNSEIFNYELDVDEFQRIIEEDVANGLIPFWCGFSYGNTFSAAVDITMRAIDICKKHKVWINVDAAFLGSTWISEKYRPPLQLLEALDSIDINFSKLLLNGTGGSLYFVGDKKIFTESMGGINAKFAFYNNAFTGQPDIVDYKDWIVGLARRNNALKIYYTFVHYGLKKLRTTVENQEEKVDYLVDLIKSHPQLFKLYTKQYALVTFQVLGKDGSPSNEITKKVTAKINNIKEGFSSPAEYRGTCVIRMVVGSFHTKKEHIKDYFQAIVRAAREIIDFP